MMSVVARAERRLGGRVPEDLLAEAERLTAKKMAVKRLPEDYAELLLEDEIVDVCTRAVINEGCVRCARFAT